ncbi:Mrp/NBP35 family ATP-binding protein [Petroclostridium sp. X23]|uniref:Mrp/NBP35 family ATP-binding protein n=1 Tax=Petroclostridium sp. X23 TaxID=3045146 RepID=UPI0024AD8555|nr:Mrp/NBP35 family ATP-binding protein [Petroclostridium sp. X23]WHH58386.1 Mrp/NBP35 family ATP-binding protein [Petroclostridium sp. X23]
MQQSSCEAQKNQAQDFLCPTNEYNDIRKVIAVLSGKGGVGKSMVTSLLSVMMRRKGFKVGILDADITGPSIPKMFGINGRAGGNENGLFPKSSHNDIKVMSVNLLLDQADAPVIWRGPLIANTVKQFWTDVLWGDLDYLFIDMPPGTGDIPLTVFQSIPLDGIIIVTSPQDLVSLIVKKAYNMAKAMNIPILGLVENMSYIQCPDCGKQIEVFGKSNLDDIAREMGLDVLARLPIDPQISFLSDQGEIEKYSTQHLDTCINKIENQLEGVESK